MLTIYGKAFKKKLGTKSVKNFYDILVFNFIEYFTAYLLRAKLAERITKSFKV